MMKRALIKILIPLVLLPLLIMSGCGDSQHKNEQARESAQTYTCPMHPQVVQHEMGTCPVCGMDLVLFAKNSSAALQLDENQIALANITTLPIGIHGVESYTELNGRLVVNPEKTAYISSRIAGRLERLYVRQTGEQINKGQPLYQIYSEQLASLQQEYLLALEQVAQFPGDRTFMQILSAARQKLILYGQSEGQLNVLKRNKKANALITYHAPESGVVAEISATEGTYVAEGSPILRVEGYQSLWVEADVYPADLQKVKTGQQLKVVVPGWEDQPQMVKVQFVSPALQPGTQVSQIRAEIPNLKSQWQPGLQAKIYLASTSKDSSLSLPVDAVIRDGKGAHVWIEKGKGKFEPQAVTTGVESADKVEIITGLKTGDRIVVTGAYLLYSEYILKKGKINI